MQVIPMPVVSSLEATMSCLVPKRGRWLTQNRPVLFDLNFRMFFQLGLRRPEFDAAHNYVTFLDRANYERDATRKRILDKYLGSNWPTRFALPRMRSPFLVFRALARDFDSLANRGVWDRLRDAPESVEEYL